MFTKAVLFTTALCQLNCNYCYICKDAAGGLKQIDDEIADSFASKEFLKSTLEATQGELRHITFWGGEPLLHLDRFTEQAQEWFETFPNLSSFGLSTNFVVPHAIEQIEALIRVIEILGPKERYSLTIQLSIDGYEAMNDAGRGQGVTKKFLQNFYRLLESPYDSKKIFLHVQLKPTLAKETFQYLDSVEKCDNWFFFFDDNLWLPYRKTRPFDFQLSSFNQAMPTEWTPEDGKDFAKIYQNIVDVDAWRYDGWKHLPSPLLIAQQLDDVDYSAFRLGSSCGCFASTVVPIPNGRYTICHRGLFDGYVDYCNNMSNRESMNGLARSYFAASNRKVQVMTLEELRRMEQTIKGFIECPNRVLYKDNLTFIKYYARAGIIDERWLDEEEVKKTLGYWIRRGYCMQDGFTQTNTWTTPSTLEYPLVYNGAMDIALKEVEKIKKG